MKKLLAIVLMMLTLLTLTVTVMASDADFVGEKEFTLASYNGVQRYTNSDQLAQQLEDSAFWLLDQKDNYNLKFVGFVGRMTTGSSHRFASAGSNDNTLIELSFGDSAWNAQNKRFTYAANALISEDMPIGISIGLNDYIPDGRRRDNLMATYMPAENYVIEGKGGYLDENNSYVIIENNGTKYLVFSLELWPRTGTLDWFIETVNANTDKYVIVYTSSFVDDSGKMYTMWDWNTGFNPAGVTTFLKGYNLTNIDKARDGEGIWNYAMAQFDNILAIISSHVNVSGILTNKVTNANGVETALIAANANSGANATAPTVLLTKISEDNKEITVAWSTAFKGVNESSIATVKLDKLGTLKEPTIDTSLPQIALQYNGANSAYIYGYEGNTFRPNANMTRAEACTIFARLLLGKQTIPDGYTTRFTDVKEGDWFHNAIAYLDETGYFFRLTSDTYKPNEPITRAEFVELANFTSSLKGTKDAVFTDVPEDHFYYDSIRAAAASGLVNGYEDNTFRPDKTITRAEVVTVINRLLGLSVSERTVAADKLENEFVDIATHWGRLNVLMASNSNVHGQYYYDVSLDGITETSSDYTFANKHFSIKISKKDARILEVINLYTGEDILATTSNSYFISQTNAKGSLVAPSKLETEGNRIKVTFKNKTVAYMIVDVEDNYMTFEIDSHLPAKTTKQITFANITVKSAIAEQGYLLNGIGMSAWTNPVYKGYRHNANGTIAYAYTVYETGTMGAKLGIAFSKKEDAISHLQEITDAIDPSVGLVSKAGGAYAREWEPNFGDYAFCTNLDPENFDETIALLKELDIDQYDIHQSSTGTFTQGDFTFQYTETGTPEEYYEKFGKKFEEAGVDTILHTYAYYIAPASTKILSDPKWQKDLELMPDQYTLRKRLSKTNRNVPTVEDATNIDVNAAFFRKTSRYVMIDNEIIYVGQGTTSGLINCQRGACGTTASTHEAGTPIYHLSGYFSMLVPKLGSDLFYHIADNTADAYNRGGFSMLYIDAIDGLSRHLPEGTETWYWFHMFLHRIVSQCKVQPQVETSASAPSEWNVRGRQGAWDYANYSNTSLKRFNKNHIESNKSSMNTNMTSTLGWYNFFTDGSQALKNTFYRTMFTDVLDFVGSNAILYDMSMVYNPFGVRSINDNPFHKANVLYYYNMYSKLRKSHYFTEEAKDKVKAIDGEWRVIEKNGKYFFQRRSYDFVNYGSAIGVQDKLEGNNIFTPQSPFIRIESRFSTLFENKQTLLEFDETQAVGTANVVKTFNPVNLANNGYIINVRVKGTGADGDAMLISLAAGANGESDGRRDHFIDLNYEGWREFVFIDFDNGDYDIDKYKFNGISTTGASYNTYRFSPSQGAINRLTIRTTGATGGNAMIDDVFYMTHTEAPIKNPTVTVGSQTMTFNCEMKGGEYLEYSPETGKAILYHNAEQTTEEVTYTGSINVASGKYTASFSAEAQTNAPIRARLTFGFSGQEIGN